MNTRISLGIACGFCLAAIAASALASDDTAARIAHAASAAPKVIGEHATIQEADGTVLREGTNGWTCMPDTMPGDGVPVCNDATWMALMSAVGNKAGFTASNVGISYMLKGDAGAGVSNSDPYHPDPKSADDYTETGPHLMIVVPRELLEGMNDDPSTGGPYVMWKDTEYAHIMVPVSDH